MEPRGGCGLIGRLQERQEGAKESDLQKQEVKVGRAEADVNNELWGLGLLRVLFPTNPKSRNDAETLDNILLFCKNELSRSASVGARSLPAPERIPAEVIEEIAHSCS